MAAMRPFWKWRRWKSIGFCLWPPSTGIWNLKLKFQSKLDLCSGNHVVYRQTDGRTDRRTDGRTRWIQYTPSNFVGRGYKNRGLRMRRECRERFPRHWLKMKPLVNDPGMHQVMCVTHVPWYMSGSLTLVGGKRFPAFPAHAQPAILRIW